MRPKLDNYMKMRSITGLGLHSFVYQQLLVFTTAFAVFYNSIEADFVYDDSVAVVNNADVTGESTSLLQYFYHDFWGNNIQLPGSHKSWRPLTTFTFRINYLIHGLQPTWFHFVNVILHSINSVAALRLVRILGIETATCTLISLLFAVHPIHCEAVSNIVGRADLLSAYFVINGLRKYIEKPNWTRVLIYTFVGVSCKETAIVLPLLCILYDFIYKRVSVVCVLKMITITATISLFRLYVNAFEYPKFSSRDNPFAYLKDRFSRVCSLAYLPIFNIRLLLIPNKLCFDWSIDSIPPIVSYLDSRFLILFLFYASSFITLVFLIYKSGLLYFTKNTVNSTRTIFYKKLLFGLSTLCISYLPASNIFCYVGFLIAERALYLPSLGYCIVIALLLNELTKRFSTSNRSSVILIVLILYASRTAQRNDDWQSEEKLYSSAVDLNPVKGNFNLALVYAKEGKLNTAINLLWRSNEVRQSADTFYNLAILYNMTGDLHRAIDCYKRALVRRPKYTHAQLNLGLLYWRNGQLTTAENIFKECCKTDIRNTKNYNSHRKAQISCMVNRARLLQLGGDVKTSVDIYLKVISEGTEQSTVNAARKWLKSAYLELKLIVETEKDATRGRENKTEEIGRKTDYMQNLKMTDLDKMQDVLSVNTTQPYFLLEAARIYKKLGIMEQEELMLKNALKLDDANLSAIEKLAMNLKEQKKYKESSKYFHHIADLRPSSVSFCNLGAILQLGGELHKAEDYYQMALQHNPNDPIVIANLKKLRRLM